ncbi:MAG: penicillin-binding protein, partial [Atopostipes suicloacalis]|nr:penicillin-binding protein [Atopostipes suicloacalis]
YKNRLIKSFSYFDSFYQIAKAIILVIILFLTVVSSLAAGAAMGYFASLVEESPQLEKNELQANIYNYNQKSTLFYADQSVISDLRSDLLRTPISLDEVSPLLVNAIIATEDENFYDHKGIVPKAILRAASQELTGASSVSGGSTITQQLVKQQILSNEVTHSRKAVEILYALDLENKFEKEEILQAYMNVSPFGRNGLGQNIAGVAEAAEGIFGVNPNNLNLAQAAFLAGLPKSPISYSPYTQYGELKEDIGSGLSRKNDVLYSMYREGYIKEKDYEEALAYDLKEDFLLQSGSEEKDSDRSYVYDLVEKEAEEIIMEKLLEKDELTIEAFEENPDLEIEYEEKAKAELKNGGYKVYSTIDPKVHHAIKDKVKQTQSSFGQTRSLTVENDDGEDQTNEFPVQVAGSLIENETGRVIAFVGGRDYEIDQYNNAFKMRRGSGSAIKPLITYGPALAENFITPATIIPDTEELVPHGSGTRPVSNYGRITNTWDSARHWLAVSQNIPNVKIYMAMLRNNMNPRKYMRAMGIGPDAIGDNEFSLGQSSTALGQSNLGPTPTELAAAYAAIGNKGVYNEPFVIDKIENSNEEIIYEHELNPTRVWSETVNYLLYDMLRDVAKVGTARSINSYLKFNVDLASKTGTTNDFRDVWYAGVTPKVSYISWMGYDNQALHLSNYGGLSPSRRNLRNWSNVMNTVYDTNPDLLGLSEQMNPPDDGSVVRQSVVAKTGMKAGSVKLRNGATAQISGENKSELFAKNNIPGTTVYDFAIGATNKELQDFWSSQSRRPQKKQEEPKEVTEEDEEEKKAEEKAEEKKKKEEEVEEEKEEEPKEEEPKEEEPKEEEASDE